MDGTINPVIVKRSLTELNYIINNMSESLQDKIPESVRESIVEQMDQNYIFNVDIDKEYTNQNFMPETKAFVSVLLSEYVGDEELKKKWRDFDKEYSEMKTKENVLSGNTIADIDIFKNRAQNIEPKVEENNKLVVVKKDTIFSKIWKKLKHLFHKN